MFRCNQCPKGFEDHSAIKRHLSTKHFFYFPYSCQICTEADENHTTATEEDMEKHIEAMHPGSDYNITTSKKRDIEDKIKAVIEDCRWISQNISANNDISLYDHSPFGRTTTESGSISSHVTQEQNIDIKTENVSVDDIEIVYEYETSVDLSVKERSNNDATENMTADKNDDYHWKMIVQRESNVNLLENTLESKVTDLSHDAPTLLATESNSCANDFPIDVLSELQFLPGTPIASNDIQSQAELNSTALTNEIFNQINGENIRQDSTYDGQSTAMPHPSFEENVIQNDQTPPHYSPVNDALIFALPELQSFHGSSTMSNATQSHARLKSVTVLDETNISPESAIKMPLRSSSNNSEAKLAQRNRNLATSDRKLQTKISSKQYYWKKDLIPHLCTRAGEKPFKCGQCSFACADKSNLDIHVRIHTGEKPFKCNKCRYASVRRATLMVHMRSHTGEKSFKCDKCQYGSVRKDALNVHMRIHTGEKPFKCSYCSFVCARNGHLKEHMRTHTGEKPYKCLHCSYAGISSSHLLSHVRNNHSKEKE